MEGLEPCVMGSWGSGPSEGVKPAAQAAFSSRTTHTSRLGSTQKDPYSHRL